MPNKKIDHFTVVSSVTWPLNGSEAGGDLVLIQTSLLLLYKSNCSNANKVLFHDQGREVCNKARSTPASLRFKARSPSRQPLNGLSTKPHPSTLSKAML